MEGFTVTYTVIVLDRGRPIAKHTQLDRDVGKELFQAYRALGWPEEKVIIQPDAAHYPKKAAA
jgi:hypothetical protein